MLVIVSYAVVSYKNIKVLSPCTRISYQLIKNVTSHSFEVFLAIIFAAEFKVWHVIRNGSNDGYIIVVGII